MKPDRLILSCEHASAAIPAKYRALFADAGATLATHRGYDLGALEIARGLAQAFGAPLFEGEFTRLFCDLNRSAHHPRVFSDYTRSLPIAEKRRILSDYHARHWSRVHAAVSEPPVRQILHVAVHSFTPILDGQKRDADIGLLYDPRRSGEKRLAAAWQELLRATHLRVRLNYPYRGRSDGLPTALRRTYPEDGYLGFELEINQGILPDAAIERAVQDSLATILGRPRSYS